MDVGTAEFRAHLSHWLDEVQRGEEVVITDRAVPVARLVGVGSASILERLVAEGLIGAPRRARASRPKAAGRAKPRAKHSVADRVSEQRR